MGKLLMSEMSDQVSSNRQKFIDLQRQNKRSYNLFVPGFLIGVFIHKFSKMYITNEHLVARPWAAIFGGLMCDSLLHYWGWKKRLMIEEMCIKEELQERVRLERALKQLKAGQDI